MPSRNRRHKTNKCLTTKTSHISMSELGLQKVLDDECLSTKTCLIAKTSMERM